MDKPNLSDLSNKELAIIYNLTTPLKHQDVDYDTTVIFALNKKVDKELSSRGAWL
jgi:hypothetical protein